MWALTKPPCQITYHWTPFHPANLHYPDQMSLGFLLHSVFWIICLQKRSSMSWSRLAPCDSFPTKTICSLYIHLQSFDLSLCTEFFSLLHLQTALFWLSFCLVSLSRKRAQLFQQLFAPFHQIPSRSKALFLASTQAYPGLSSEEKECNC